MALQDRVLRLRVVTPSVDIAKPASGLGRVLLKCSMMVHSTTRILEETRNLPEVVITGFRKEEIDKRGHEYSNGPSLRSVVANGAKKQTKTTLHGLCLELLSCRSQLSRQLVLKKPQY